MTIKTTTIKKGIAVLTLGATLLSSAAVFAKNDDHGEKEARKAKIEKIREEIKQKREEIKEMRKSGSGSTASGKTMEDKEHKGKKTGSGRTVIGKNFEIENAMITGINGTDLMITKGSKSVTVHTGSGTTIKRRFGAVAKWSEFTVNQFVDVKGKWTNEMMTEGNATWIRNRSIQKRNGVFNGVVTSVTGSGFTLNTFGRGTQSVFPDSSTQIVDRKGATLTLGNILVGHMLTVKGVWDRTNHTITEVMMIKDKSLPTGSGSSL